jgi:hypothetical protein
MNCWKFALAVLMATTACSADQGCCEAGRGPFPTVYVGEWRSVTPTLEFVRLTVRSKSGEQGVLASRLSYSGVYWEGDGRVDGDSLVSNMNVPGISGPATRLVMRSLPDENTLQVRHDTQGAQSVTLTFIREN